MTPQEFFNSIDYEQLVFQKEMLLQAIIYRADDTDDTDAEGLIAMIDALQDTAAELFGEEKVFLFKKKEEYLKKYKEYIMDNRLEDDSDYIYTKSLFEFVDDHIIPGEDEEEDGDDGACDDEDYYSSLLYGVDNNQ